MKKKKLPVFLIISLLSLLSLSQLYRYGYSASVFAKASTNRQDNQALQQAIRESQKMIKKTRERFYQQFKQKIGYSFFPYFDTRQSLVELFDELHVAPDINTRNKYRNRILDHFTTLEKKLKKTTPGTYLMYCKTPQKRLYQLRSFIGDLIEQEKTPTQRKKEEEEKRRNKHAILRITSNFEILAPGTAKIDTQWNIDNKALFIEKLKKSIHKNKKFFYKDIEFDVEAQNTERHLSFFGSDLISTILSAKKDNIVYTDFGARDLRGPSLRILILFLLSEGSIKDIHLIDISYKKVIDLIKALKSPQKMASRLKKQDIFKTTNELNRLVDISSMLSVISKNKINLYIHDSAYAYIDFLKEKNMEKADIITAFAIPFASEWRLKGKDPGQIASLKKLFSRRLPSGIYSDPFLDLCFAVIKGAKNTALFIFDASIKKDFKEAYKRYYNIRLEALNLKRDKL